MPQATEELRSKFPGGDWEAWEVLRANFDDHRGLIRVKTIGYSPTDREYDAIDYLCDEWDYAYEVVKQLTTS